MVNRMSMNEKRKQLWQQGEHICYWCGKQLTPNAAVIEHRTPMILGGANRLENLVLACRECHTCRTPEREMLWACADDPSRTGHPSRRCRNPRRRDKQAAYAQPCRQTAG